MHFVITSNRSEELTMEWKNSPLKKKKKKKKKKKAYLDAKLQSASDGLAAQSKHQNNYPSVSLRRPRLDLCSKPYLVICLSLSLILSLSFCFSLLFLALHGFTWTVKPALLSPYSCLCFFTLFLSLSQRNVIIRFVIMGWETEHCPINEQCPPISFESRELKVKSADPLEREGDKYLY